MQPNRVPVISLLLLAVLLLPAGREPFYTLKLDVISSGYDGEKVWFHPRAGIVAGERPQVVLTMQKWWIQRSDVFFALSQTISNDLGKHWSTPAEQARTLGRHTVAKGLEVGISDFTPKWHAKTGKLLGTGHTVRYQDNTLIKGAPRSTVWSVFDEATQSWSAWDTLKLPDLPMFYSEGAGSTQRVDLPNGEILLPTYFMKKGDSLYSATVLRCTFDGKQLTYIEHGDILKHPTGRGFPEPSLTYFKDRFYLTLRNDDSAYVASSKDGLHFSKPQIWRFDDGQPLESYNTQQHWVTHSSRLYLVYTRRGANNDNVARHRAPLFMAQVDPKKLVVLRHTEQILVPNKGAQLGNFGVVNINPRETWITTSEGMARTNPTQFGADGRVYAARIQWSKPNKTWNTY